MPQRKDPEHSGASGCGFLFVARREPRSKSSICYPARLKTRSLKKAIHPGTAADYGIRSVSIPGYAYVYVQLAEDISDVKRQFSDINLKLNALNSNSLQAPVPFRFQSDFGDTAALMLTIASPKADSVEIDIRARGIHRPSRRRGPQGNPRSQVHRSPLSTPFLNLFP